MNRNSRRLKASAVERRSLRFRRAGGVSVRAGAQRAHGARCARRDVLLNGSEKYKSQPCFTAGELMAT